MRTCATARASTSQILSELWADQELELDTCRAERRLKLLIVATAYS